MRKEDSFLINSLHFTGDILIILCMFDNHIRECNRLFLSFKQSVIMTGNLFMNNYSMTIQSFLPFLIIYSPAVSYWVDLQVIYCNPRHKRGNWAHNHQPHHCDTQGINDVLLRVESVIIISNYYRSKRTPGIQKFAVN